MYSQVKIANNKNGQRLTVDGKDFMINGMNWDYFPIGTTYTYSLWDQSDKIIEAALKSEMSLLKDMGVNAVRQYTGIPAKWIQYIYEHYGIYTMLNHPFGRYGLTLEEEWVANTSYEDPRVKELLLTEITTLVKEYKNTPGLLLYLLGNENNYGLFWEGAETEDIPKEDQNSLSKASALYKLFNEAAKMIKSIDRNHPVAICNGDLQFMELIVEECKDIDIFGTNMYRGISFGDAFQRVADEFNKPILFTEFGADAFNAIDQKEDQHSQAYYMKGNWKEIYGNAAGLGKANNCIGGFTFQFSDGWWKYDQTNNLKVHDKIASWGNGGYASDYKKNMNNMNEEWFGVCAKGPTNKLGLYELHPRAAYYTLKKVHRLNPYDKAVTIDVIKAHFSNIKISKASN
jgi:beta-galactosidase/beta-glucuronidase